MECLNTSRENRIKLTDHEHIRHRTLIHVRRNTFLQNSVTIPCVRTDAFLKNRGGNYDGFRSPAASR